MPRPKLPPDSTNRFRAWSPDRKRKKKQEQKPRTVSFNRSRTGCTKCRQRKVKCDEAKPSCSRCEQSGYECKYEAPKAWIFDPKTAHRRAPDLPQEDPSKPSSLSSTAPVDPEAQAPVALHAPPQCPAKAKSVNHATKPDSAVVSTPRDWPLHLHPAATAMTNVMMHVHLWSLFLDSYRPKQHIAFDGNGEWVALAISTPQKGAALKLSLSAVALTRLAWIHEDRSMAERGQVVYTHALRATQNALWNPELVRDDETLAAVRLLRLYEGLECPSSSVKPYMTHMRGITKIVEIRGDLANFGQLGCAVVKDWLRRMMLGFLLDHNHSPGSLVRCLSNLFSNKDQDHERRLLEQAYYLAQLSCETRKVVSNMSSAAGDDARDILETLCGRILRSNHGVQACYEATFQERGIHWQPNAPTARSNSVGERPEEDHLFSTSAPVYPNHDVALETITLWGLKLYISEMAYQLKEHFAKSNQTIPRSVRFLEDIYSADYRVQLSNDIINSLTYLIDSPNSLIAAQGALWPVYIARVTARYHKAEMTTNSDQIAQRFADTTGLKIAQYLHLPQPWFVGQG